MNWLLWILRLVAAGILLQTLYFKFTAQPESVHIFSTLGMEPWGRIGSGVVELIAGILILYPRTTGIGALLSVGTLSGAIFFHLTSLGISINGDSSLFYLAVITWLASAVLAFVFRQQIFNLVR